MNNEELQNKVNMLSEQVKELMYEKNNQTSDFQTKVVDQILQHFESQNPFGIGKRLVASDPAILQVLSLTKGVRFPNMTTTQRDAIVTPQAGLLIFNTTTSVYNFHNGTIWGAI